MLLQNILTKNNFVNLLILLIPLSYIAGNLVLNINIFFFILFALVAFNLKIFHRKLSKTDILVIILFSYIILNGLLNNF